MSIDLTHGIHGIKKWDILKVTQAFELWKKEIQEWIFLKVWEILWDNVTIFEEDDNSPTDISLKELAKHVERIGNTKPLE